MAKSLKIMSSILISLVLLVTISVVAVILFVQPNSFKPQIIAAVKNKTGRDLEIDGDLKLTLFPSLALSTGKMTLHNTSAFQPDAFATLDASQINVELLPLLSKRIEVSGIKLTGLTVNLITNEQGEKNWQDLMSAKAMPVAAAPNNQATPSLTSTALGALSIGQVTLVNGQIHWQNLQTGKSHDIKGLNLNSDKLEFNKPIKLDIAFASDDIVGKTKSQIKLNTVLTTDEKLNQLNLANSKVELLTTGENVPNKSLTSTLNITTISASVPQQNIDIQGLQLNAADLAITANTTGQQLQNNPIWQGNIAVASFNPSKLLKDFAIAMPAIGNSNVFTQLTTHFNFSASKNALTLQEVELNLNDTTIKGAATLLPNLRFHLSIDNLDLDRYLPPVAKDKKKITSPTIALLAGTRNLPIETLKTLDMDGNLAIANLQVNNLKLQNIQLHINAKDGIINSQQAIKQFYQGEYAGNMKVDARHIPMTLAINEELKQVQIEPLLHDFKDKAQLRGTVNAAAQLQAKGQTDLELKSSLNGFLRVSFQDGAIIGFSLQKMLDKAKSLMKGTDLTNVATAQEETPFMEISATAAINKGIIKNQDLLARTRKLRVTGNGTANLVTEQLDYKITANLLKQEATITDPEQFHQAAVGIIVGGSFSQPIYKLDISSLITDKTKEKVEKIIENVQNNEKTKAKIENALEKLTPEQQEKVKKVAPKVGKLLKKLF